MDKLVKSFVSDRFPDFVVSDHPKFKLFLEAYYEWMEQQNNGTVTSVRNYFEALPNASGLIVNQDLNKDVDETLDLFLDFFRKDVIPVIVNKEKVDQRFFIKKIRDLYLSKGSPKSYKLLFRLLFDEEISIFETKNNVIRSSDGNYLSFPYSVFRVVDRSENLDDIDFTLSTITGTNVDGIILSGTFINKDSQKRTIIKTQLSEKYSIQVGETYTITDVNDDNVFIKVEALPVLDTFEIVSKGALNSVGDEIILRSDYFDIQHIGEVTTVSEGSVEKVFIRSRGYGYSVGDKILFSTQNAADGSGGVAFVTAVDNAGRITELNNTEIRTTLDHDGFISGSLVDVKIDIDDGGWWNKIPNVEFDLTETVFKGWPFSSESITGTGLELTPLSDSIGQINTVFLQSQPYFDSEADAFITLPTQVALQNIDGIEVGNVVCFQKFKKNDPNLRDDSEPFILDIGLITQLLPDSDGSGLSIDAGLYGTANYINTGIILDAGDFNTTATLIQGYPTATQYNSTGVPTVFDSDLVWGTNVKIPYGYDSETFEWKTFDYTISKSTGFVDPLTLTTDTFTNLWESKLDSESAFKDGVYTTLRDDYIIDGGSTFDEVATDVIAGHTTFSYLPSYTNIGATLIGYEYNKYIKQIIRAKFSWTNEFIDQLEAYHFEDLNKLNEKSIQFDYKSLKTDSLVKYIPPDAGGWYNTGLYGIVKNIRPDEGVVTLQRAVGYNYPNDSDINNIYKDNLTDKYVMLRLGVYNGVDSESISLPLTNIVAQMNQATVSYTLAAAVDSKSIFANERGFLSNLGMVIQDNYYYSTYTYIVSTKVPMNEWREKVKTLLHPAGTYLFSNLQVEQPATFSGGFVDTVYSKPRSVAFTFDTSLEHYDTKLKVGGIFADNILYAVNSFEFVTTNDPMGRQLTPSVYYENTILRDNYQHGDSWWDYEPLGLVADWTTQDSDGLGLIKQQVIKYTTSKRKPYINNPTVLSTSLINMDTNSYSVYDSDVFVSAGIEKIIFSNAGNDSESYRQIVYSNLVNLGLNKGYKTTLTKRKTELLFLQEKDFDLALRDPDTYTYDVGGITYNGFEAFDKKWNTTSNRTINNGWSIVGHTSKIQNNTQHIANRKTIYFIRNNVSEWVNKDTSIKSRLPVTVNTTDFNNWWNWNDTYKIKINKNSVIDTSKQVSELFDIRTIMKKRRGS